MDKKMSKKSKKKCENCKYYYTNVEEVERGECRRYAPRPYVNLHEGLVHFPVVYNTDWCGEFEREER